jgi:hypothetical protein
MKEYSEEDQARQSLQLCGCKFCPNPTLVVGLGQNFSPNGIIIMSTNANDTPSLGF